MPGSYRLATNPPSSTPDQPITVALIRNGLVSAAGGWCLFNSKDLSSPIGQADSLDLSIQLLTGFTNHGKHQLIAAPVGGCPRRGQLAQLNHYVFPPEHTPETTNSLLDLHIRKIARDRLVKHRQDICQNAFIRALHNLDKFDPCRGSFDVWLGVIARSEVSEAVRARHYRDLQPFLEEQFAEEMVVEDSLPCYAPEEARAILTQMLAGDSLTDEQVGIISEHNLVGQGIVAPTGTQLDQEKKEVLNQAEQFHQQFTQVLAALHHSFTPSAMAVAGLESVPAKTLERLARNSEKTFDNLRGSDEVVADLVALAAVISTWQVIHERLLEFINAVIVLHRLQKAGADGLERQAVAVVPHFAHMRKLLLDIERLHRQPDEPAPPEQQSAVRTLLAAWARLSQQFRAAQHLSLVYQLSKALEPLELPQPTRQVLQQLQGYTGNVSRFKSYYHTPVAIPGHGTFPSDAKALEDHGHRLKQSPLPGHPLLDLLVESLELLAKENNETKQHERLDQLESAYLKWYVQSPKPGSLSSMTA